MRVGLDIGSTTIKCAVLDEHDALIYSTYERHYSHILEKAHAVPGLSSNLHDQLLPKRKSRFSCELVPARHCQLW